MSINTSQGQSLKYVGLDFHISVFTHGQFYVAVSQAMSINKSQGQSLKYVGLDFHTSVFTHGQFYVAVSQATSVHRIKAIWDPKSAQPVTKNIVYSEVLLD